MMQNAIFYTNTKPESIGMLAVTGISGRRDLFVPLRRVSLKGTLGRDGGQATLLHTFSFPKAVFPYPIEAVHRFMIPKESLLTGCTACFSDETLSGEMYDRDDAAEIYHDAFFQGRRGFFLRKEPKDRYTLHLAGIEPDHEVTVAVYFSWKPESREDEQIITIPLPVLPGSGRWTDPLCQLSDPGYRFSLDLVLAGEGRIDCDTHPVLCERRDGAMHLSLTEEEIIPDRDIVLRFSNRDDAGSVSGSFECHALSEGSAFVATGPGRRAPVRVTVAVPSATPSLQAFCCGTEAVSGMWAGAGWPVFGGIAYETRHARMENFAVT